MIVKDAMTHDSEKEIFKIKKYLFTNNKLLIMLGNYADKDN